VSVLVHHLGFRQPKSKQLTIIFTKYSCRIDNVDNYSDFSLIWPKVNINNSADLNEFIEELENISKEVKASYSHFMDIGSFYF